jgi:hypothetical protein
MKQLGSHWTELCEIRYLRMFRKICRIIQVGLKSYKNNGYFVYGDLCIYEKYLSEFLLD